MENISSGDMDKQERPFAAKYLPLDLSGPQPKTKRSFKVCIPGQSPGTRVILCISRIFQPNLIF